MSAEKESANRETKPYRAEYAASNRARCKKCEQTIPKDSLKLAYMVKSRFHDGFDAKNCHLKCFFEIKRPKSIAEIGNYEKLKFEDQKLLEEALETNASSVLSTEACAGLSNRDDENAKKGGKNIELAKSNRSTCKSCQEKIIKDSIRIGKLDFEVDMNASYAASGPMFRWHHLECFAKNCNELEFYGEVSKVKGFVELEEDHQNTVKISVKTTPKSETSSPVKKIKNEKETLEEEKRLKRQSDRYYKLREIIAGMKKAHVASMLAYMNQKSNFKVGSSLVDMATDVMLFGPLDPCPKCKGHLILKSSAYVCTGGTEEEPCKYETRDPIRGAPDVPDEICEEYPFFSETYVFKPRPRIFPTKLVKAIENKEANEGKIIKPDAPLIGFLIGVSSWKFINTDKEKVIGQITSLGAKLQTNVDKNVFLIVTSEDEVTKSGPKIEVAAALDIPFVKAKFLFEIKNSGDVVKAIKDNIIGDYNKDLKERYDKFVAINSSNNIVKKEY